MSDDITMTGNHLPDDEDKQPAQRFTTRQDAIEQAIMPALTEGNYDYEAICYEAFEWKIDVNGQDQELLNTGGFEQVVSDEQFWAIAAKHEIS